MKFYGRVLERLAHVLRRARWLRRFGGLWEGMRPLYNRLILSASRNEYVLRRPAPGHEIRICHGSMDCISDGMEREVFACYEQLVRSGFTVWDVGANHGCHAIVLARLVGPTGHVHAFEPVPAHVMLLRENLKLNGCANVRVVDAALGENEGVEGIQVSGGAVSSLLRDGEGACGLSKVHVTTGDRYSAASAVVPDLVKIDVEGYELPVLRGMRRMLQESPATRVICEMHPHQWHLVPCSADDFVRFLSEIGYVALKLDGSPCDRETMQRYGHVLLAGERLPPTSEQA